MQDSDNWTTAGDDKEAEGAVMQQVLSLHPTQLTVAELVRAIAGEEVGFGERDAIERAVVELAAAGLVHRRQSLVLPTRAALRLNELLDH